MKFRLSPLRAAVSAGFLGTALCSSISVAQVQEITVTAEFREENVQDTPIAITAVNSEMLDARNQTSIYEVGAQAPNVTLLPAGQSRSGMVAFIRGIGQADFSFALEPGVGIYVDDVYYPTLSSSLLELIDIDRVEVLRGPQGTLAGRNSIGGAVKIYSKRPGDADGARVQVGMGSYNEMSISGSTDLTLVPDTLYGRVAFASKERDGYVDVLDYGCVYPDSGVPMNNSGDCKTGEYGDQRYTTGRLSLQWFASDDVEVNVSADILNDSSGAPAATLWQADTDNPLLLPVDDGDPATPPVYYQDHIFVPYGPYAPEHALDDPYVAFSTECDFTEPAPGVTWKPFCVKPSNTMESWGLSAQVDWTLTDTLSLVSITSYREYETYFTDDGDLSPIAGALLGQHLSHESFTQEFRLNGAIGNGFDYTVGTYYLDQEGETLTRADLNYSGLDFISGKDITPASSLALFGHGTFHLSDAFDLSLGVRWTDEEKDYTYGRHNPDWTVPGPPPAPNWQVGSLNGLQSHFEDERVDYRAALNYNFANGVMAYAQVSTGFKGGGVNPRPYFAEQAQPFQPEELLSYEIGAKSVLFDNRLRVNGAVFYNEYDDIQLNLTACEGPGSMPNDPPNTAVPCLAPRNVGNAEVSGVELEVEYYATDALSIDASVSSLDFEYTEVDAFALQGSPIDPLDMIAPFTPELQWSLGVQYDFQPVSIGEFSVRVDSSYRDEVYSEATNRPTNRVDDYTLTNARLSWNSLDELWNVAFSISNLTDEVYYLSSLDQSGNYGSVRVQPGMPRTWALTLRRDFQ